MGRVGMVVAALVVVAGCSSDRGQGGSGLSPAARQVMEGGLRHLGALPATVGFRSGGTLNKDAEGQGFGAGRPSEAGFEEVVVVDLARGRAGRHYREDRPDGTFEWVAEMYGPDDRSLTVLPSYGVAVLSSDPEAGAGRDRIARRIPQVLLREILAVDPPGSLVDGAQGQLVVQAALESGRPVRLAFSPSDTVLASVQLEDHVEGRGPVPIVWRFSDYREAAPGTLLPNRYAVDVDGDAYLRMVVTAFLDPEPIVAAFEPPDSLRLIDQATPAGAQDAEPDPGEGSATEPELVLEPVAEGVFQVPEVRGGFAPLVVAFADFTVVVDAPAGFPLLSGLPPDHTDPAPSMSHHSERLVDAVLRRFPDRPLRYVILTHAHLDHLGGVRAFVAAGATVLGAPTTRSAVEALMARSDLRPDRLAAAPSPLVWEDVTQVRELSDGTRTLRILPMGENPHDPGMLVVELPADRLMFVSDMVTPGPVDRYPWPHHEALDRFFQSWLDARGLDPERVLAMHGSGELTRAHRARLR